MNETNKAKNHSVVPSGTQEQGALSDFAPVLAALTQVLGAPPRA